MYLRTISAMVITGFLAGCSSSMPAGQLASTVDERKSLSGIPYRVAKRFEVIVYEKRDEGYVPVHSQPFTLADPYNLYWIGFEGLPLSNGSVDIAFNPDSTLQQATLKSSTTAPATLTALGTGTAAIVSGVAGLETAREAEEAAERAAETAAANNAIAAEAAYQAAKEAELTRIVKDSDPLASAADRLKAVHAERLAKLRANEAARLASLPPYFPGVVAGGPY